MNSLKKKQNELANPKRKVDEVQNSLTKMIMELAQTLLINNYLNKSISLKSLLYSIEIELIEASLVITSGNQRLASEVLGIKPTTMNEKIKKHNINAGKFKPKIEISRIFNQFHNSI